MFATTKSSQKTFDTSRVVGHFLLTRGALNITEEEITKGSLMTPNSAYVLSYRRRVHEA